MQSLIKFFFNYLKIAGINLLILSIIIIIIELIFGYWFNKDNWGDQIRSWRYKKVEYSSEFNNKKYTFLYKRNSYGFRGDEDDPSKIKIVFLGGSTGNERFIPEELTIVGNINTFLKSKNFKYKIHNASVDGQSSIGYINNFKIWFPRINNFNPKIYVIYLGVNERYYTDYDPNPPDILTDKFKGGVNDFDTLRKAKFKDQIFDRIKNNSFFYEKGKVLQLRFFTPKKRTASYDPNKFKTSFGSVEMDNLKFINNDEANKIYNKEELLIKYSLYAKSLTKRLDYLNKIIKNKNALPIFVNQVMVNGQGSEFMFITNVIIRKYCTDNNIGFIDLAREANLIITDFYDDFHTTPDGSNKIAKFIQNDLLKFFKKNLGN
jgi:hypothetical protein